MFFGEIDIMAKGFKTGGHMKGNPNKITFHTRHLTANVIARELQQLSEILGTLD